MISISIIFATYNRVSALERTLISLQSIGIFNCSDIEVIIVNNHEQSHETVKKLLENYPVILSLETKKGKSFAINHAISLVSGEYVFFTDDDIVFVDLNFLRTMVNEFKSNVNLGYCSGNVIQLNKNENIATTFENKGGFSKGKEKKYWNMKFLNSKKYWIFPWLFKNICIGANNMIPKKVLDKIGGYDSLLGTPEIVAGETLEIGYRIAKNGYELLYIPDLYILHEHPTTDEELIKKLYTYGVGDTAHPMRIFIKFGDFRYLWWSLFGHSIYTISKIIKRILGKYPLPIKYIFASLKGNISGSYLLIYYLIKSKIKSN